jgi:FkbM family methyltransferase
MRQQDPTRKSVLLVLGGAALSVTTYLLINPRWALSMAVPPPPRRPRGAMFLEQLPDMGVSVAKVAVQQPFLYGYLGGEQGIEQLQTRAVRALDPGLTALWVNRTSKCCRMGGHVVDVGSHFGYWSLLSASLGCSFSAFEPVPLYVSLLRMNVHLNRLDQAGEVLPLALGQREGSVKVVGPRKGGSGGQVLIADPNRPVRYRRKARPVTVRQATLAGVLAGKRLPPVCAMRVDAQGWENDIMVGALPFLRKARVPHFLLELSAGGQQAEGLSSTLGALYGLGYKAVEVGWDVARLDKAPGDIDVGALDVLPVDISTTSSRQAFIDRVFNGSTSLWFTR